MIIWKYKIIQIWEYTNVHVEKYRCEKFTRECKESKYIYKIYKGYKLQTITTNRNVNKEIKKKNIKITNV